MKILMIDPHRPEFFHARVCRELRARGHEVCLSRAIPLDILAFDVIVCVYADKMAGELSFTNATVPLVVVGMGTDLIVGSFRQINFSGVDVLLTFNPEHIELLARATSNEARTLLGTWSAYDKGLKFRSRPQLDRKNGRLSGLRLLNSALHVYSKGLDNLVQNIQALDRSVIDVDSLELHVIGPVYSMDNNAYLSYYLQWFATHVSDFKLFFHGEQHPDAIDSYIESIDPHAYITASQGECGATTVAEGLIKGLPVFVQDHPFAVGIYRDTVVTDKASKMSMVDYNLAAKNGLFMYNTAADLSKAIDRAFPSSEDETLFTSDTARAYGLKNFSFDKMIDSYERAIKEAVIARAEKLKGNK